MRKTVCYHICYECGMIRRITESKCPICGNKRSIRTGGGIPEEEFERRAMELRNTIVSSGSWVRGHYPRLCFGYTEMSYNQVVKWMKLSRRYSVILNGVNSGKEIQEKCDKQLKKNPSRHSWWDYREVPKRTRLYANLRQLGKDSSFS